MLQQPGNILEQLGKYPRTAREQKYNWRENIAMQKDNIQCCGSEIIFFVSGSGFGINFGSGSGFGINFEFG
jgi:hypothetical protein